MTEGSVRRRSADAKGSGDVCRSARKRLAPYDVGLTPLWRSAEKAGMEMGELQIEHIRPANRSRNEREIYSPTAYGIQWMAARQGRSCWPPLTWKCQDFCSSEQSKTAEQLDTSRS